MRIPKCIKCNKIMTFINTRFDKNKNIIARYKCLNNKCTDIEIHEILLRKEK